MEGQNGCNNSLQMLSLNFGPNVNIVSQVTGDCSTNHHHVSPADRNVYQTNLPHSIEWTRTAKISPSFVEFIAETSNFPRKACSKDMIAVVPVNTVQTIDAVSEICGEISYNHPEGSYSSNPTDSRNNASCILSKPGRSSSSRRSYSTDRQRRIRIAEKVGALQELLPPSSKGNQASALDDVIDHIKHLQLQIKDLSQSKLGGESSSEPFIFVEGYGHYMRHEEMQGEPLEEMVGKLLEVEPLAAAQLLEKKGVFVMPMDFVERLC